MVAEWASEATERASEAAERASESLERASEKAGRPSEGGGRRKMEHFSIYVSYGAPVADIISHPYRRYYRSIIICSALCALLVSPSL